MTISPKVSIVTVFYNRAETVQHSMNSLIEQDYDNFEIIAIDDGSSDDTLTELEKFNSHKNVRVICLENGGFVKAIKYAISISEGEFIAVHGSGDLSHPMRVRLQAEELKNKPHVGVVASKSKFVIVDSDVEYIKGDPVSCSFETLLLKKNYFHHGEVMYRKSLYDKVGGYRELFKFAQDMDLWCRMSHHCHFTLLDEVLYTRYVNQPDSVSENPSKTKLQRKLGQFAVYCHKCRIEEKYDPYEKYGYYSLIDFIPNKMGYIYFKQAVRHMISGKRVNAIEFLESSKLERYYLSFIVDAVYRFSPNLVEYIVSNIYKKTGNH